MSSFSLSKKTTKQPALNRECAFSLTIENISTMQSALVIVYKVFTFISFINHIFETH